MIVMMAAEKFIIKCQTEEDSFTVQDLSSNSTVQDLKISPAKIFNCSPQSLKIMTGYPPRALIEGCDIKTLEYVNIQSGETVVVQRRPVAAPTIAAPIQPNRHQIRDVAPHFMDFEAAGNGSLEFDRVQEENSRIMVRQVVPRTSSCMFISTSFCLSNGKCDESRAASLLRRIIKIAVSENPMKFDAFSLGMSNSDYCNSIRNHYHWGGDIELAILSEQFSVEIFVIDTFNEKCRKFGEDRHYADRIYLICDADHYDPLIMELESGEIQTRFSVTDGYPLEKALEIGTSLKQFREFNDLALLCSPCAFSLYQSCTL